MKCFICHKKAKYVCEGYSFCSKHAKEFDMGYGKSIKQLILEDMGAVKKKKKAKVEKRHHPENFVFDVPDRYPTIPEAIEAGLSTISVRPIKIKKSAKRGSAKESKSIAHKKREEAK